MCGATDHPYAKGNLPGSNRAEVGLKKAKAKYKKISEKLRKRETEQAMAAAEIRHAGKKIEEKRTAQGADEKACGDALLKLNIRAAAEGRAAEVRKELAGVRLHMAEAGAAIQAAEGKVRAEKAARTALERVRTQFERSGETLRDARHQSETAHREHERLIRERDALAEEIQKVRTAALARVKPFGVAEIPTAGLDVLLQDLTGRRDMWQIRRDEKAAAEKRIFALKASADHVGALLANLERDLAAKREDHEKRTQQVESLSASRRELFGEKNADEEEKRLADAEDRAGRAFEEAREACGRSGEGDRCPEGENRSVEGQDGREGRRVRRKSERNLTERIFTGRGSMTRPAVSLPA